MILLFSRFPVTTHVGGDSIGRRTIVRRSDIDSQNIKNTQNVDKQARKNILNANKKDGTKLIYPKGTLSKDMDRSRKNLLAEELPKTLTKDDRKIRHNKK